MRQYPKIPLNQALVAVTGGAQGIGLATARAFQAAGARVAIGDLDADLAEWLARPVRRVLQDDAPLARVDAAARRAYLERIGATESKEING